MLTKPTALNWSESNSASLHQTQGVSGVGSLDDPKVRKYAEDLLEGGRAAFDARKRLYDF